MTPGDPECEQAIERLRLIYDLQARSESGTPEWERVTREYFHPDFVFRPLRGFADVDETRGINAFLDWMRSYLSAWVDFKFELYEVECVEHRLLVRARITARGRTSGMELGGDIYELVELQDGLIISLEHHGTRDGALRAAGVS